MMESNVGVERHLRDVHKESLGVKSKAIVFVITAHGATCPIVFFSDIFTSLWHIDNNFSSSSGFSLIRKLFFALPKPSIVGSLSYLKHSAGTSASTEAIS